MDCVCVCVCVRARTRVHVCTHVYVYMQGEEMDIVYKVWKDPYALGQTNK